MSSSSSPSGSSQRYPTQDDMTLLKTSLADLRSNNFEFPLDASQFYSAGGRGHSGRAAGDVSPSASKDVSSTGSTLTPPLAPGVTHVIIFIEKIGLKDAPKYKQPKIAINVFDDKSKRVEATHESEESLHRVDNHLYFEQQMYMQTPLEELRAREASIFSEFKHYKVKRGGYFSVRCWSLMEIDELVQPGKRILELYRKPADYSKKKIKLFTEKKLYLYVEVQHRTL